ncbi:hypothetical protein [Pseudorhodoplanes sinuspersici]|uniref:Uncharacterized protein n=1 Tax=Pseudorhodoplanes sinuspersici TaxID=1235591 RepID=A0A1W6ZPJ9_9HYPH|nr:hypothetical protein [Pseudorhodoplanes sinuspersici]ARP99301.1 hypothetical protein CAK95_09565 [Pseudorhodoplanes sinuspersici]RKE69014.1 hypothetical protein DFP91_3438 [Pseudorhodoplanes sinuspersici]
MASFVINASNSVVTSVNNVHAFSGDTGGSLIATGVNGLGAYLANTGGWKAAINGVIKSGMSDGMLFAETSAKSTVTIGANGEVSGRTGLFLEAPVTVNNAGTIVGNNYGILIQTSGALDGTFLCSSCASGNQNRFSCACGSGREEWSKDPIPPDRNTL